MTYSTPRPGDRGQNNLAPPSKKKKLTLKKNIENPEIPFEDLGTKIVKRNELSQIYNKLRLLRHDTFLMVPRLLEYTREAVIVEMFVVSL